MTQNGSVVQAIYDAIDEVNQQLPGKQRIEKSTDTVLFGRSGKLDSLGLVNLIVSVEERVEEEFGIVITIADERAMSQRNSPFKSVGTFADYISLLLEERTRIDG